MSDWEVVKLYVEKLSSEKRNRRKKPLRHIIVITDIQSKPSGLPSLAPPSSDPRRVAACMATRRIVPKRIMKLIMGGNSTDDSGGVSLSCIAVERASVPVWSSIALQGMGNVHFCERWSKGVLANLSKELNGITSNLRFSDVVLELFPLNGLHILKKGIRGCPEARYDQSLRREGMRGAKGSVRCPIGFLRQGEISRVQVSCAVPRVLVPDRNLFMQYAVRFRTTTADGEIVLRGDVRLEVTSSKPVPILPGVFRSGLEIQNLADVFRGLGQKICSGGFFWRQKLARIKTAFKKHLGNDPTGHFERIISRFFSVVDRRALGKDERACQRQQDMGRHFVAFGSAVDAGNDFGYLSGHDSDARCWSEDEPLMEEEEEEDTEEEMEEEGEVLVLEVENFDDLLSLTTVEEEEEMSFDDDFSDVDNDDRSVLVIGENEDFDEDEMEGETPCIDTQLPVDLNSLEFLGVGGEFSPPSSPQPEFKVLNPADLAQDQQGKILAVADAIHSSVGVAAKLLRHYQWNQQNLCLDYVADRDAVCEEAGVILSQFPVRIGPIGEEMECVVCFDDFPGEEMFALSCEHFFCRQCWERHLHVRIADGPDCLMSKCQWRGCGNIVAEELVREVCSYDDAALFNRYYLRSLVEDNPKVKWCPAPDCGRAVHVPDADVENVRCSCGEMFCFKCGSEAHQPASCEEMEKWKEKAEGDHSAKVWIAENTKPCPRCKKNIEKNGGCNHMTCTQCHYQFCWLCRGNWGLHELAGGGCILVSRDGSQRAMERKAQASDVVKAREFLEVYEIFKEQGVSQEFEREMNRRVAEMGTVLRRRHRYSAWTELSNISRAASVLLDCRRAMKYSYVKSYLMKLRPGGGGRSPEKELFDHLQSELFRTTEHLAELLERNSEDVEHWHWNRDEVSVACAVARTRLRNLFEAVKGGLTNV